MPGSAVATGCVDFVLPPPAIARELCRRGGAPARDAAPPAQPAPPSPEPEVNRQVPLGAQRLFTPAARFAALEARVFPQLASHQPPTTAIRVWVPGCSTGEEVYSLAICLFEYLTKNDLAHVTLQLFGTDLDTAALDRARSGLFGPAIERDVTKERLQRFFVRRGQLYVIRGSIRNLCVFAPHDPANHPPLARMDLISCPQHFDQLEAHAQARLQSLFAYALKPNGFLVLGRSELAPPGSGFGVVHAEERIYQRMGGGVAPQLDFQTPPYLPDLVSNVAEPGEAANFRRVQDAADRLLLARLVPPGVVISGEGTIVEFRGNTAPYLEVAPGLATLDLLQMARPELRDPLREAINHARASHAPVRHEAVRLAGKKPRQLANIEVTPFRVAGRPAPYFLVLFDDPFADSDGARPLLRPRCLRRLRESSWSPDTPSRRSWRSSRRVTKSCAPRMKKLNPEPSSSLRPIISCRRLWKSCTPSMRSCSR